MTTSHIGEHPGEHRERGGVDREPLNDSNNGPVRPRERLSALGPTALSDAELLAVIIGGGHAEARARELLQHLGGLVAVSRATVHELCAVHGIGLACATAVRAAFEIARRVEQARLPLGRVLNNPHAVSRFVRASLRGATQEVFWVIGLNARQHVCRVAEVGRGTVARVSVHPREVFAPLLRSGAHTCILAHNHPSGVLSPSREDIDMTQRLCRAAEILGIVILDHIVVTDSDYCSMSESGLMPSVLQAS